MAALMRSLLALVGTVVVVFFLWVQPFFPFFLRLTGGAEWSLGSLPGLKLITLHIIFISGRRAALLNQAGVEKSATDQLKYIGGGQKWHTGGGGARRLFESRCAS